MKCKKCGCDPMCSSSEDKVFWCMRCNTEVSFNKEKCIWDYSKTLSESDYLFIG